MKFRFSFALVFLVFLNSCGPDHATSRLVPEPDLQQRLEYEKQMDSIKDSKSNSLQQNIPTH